MKRLLSICLAMILVMSFGGYQLPFYMLRAAQQKAMEQKVNRGVPESELISLKVPASLPYYSNAADFQWTAGEVEMEGVIYQYVKRRIYNDSIEYLCLPNKDKTKLVQTEQALTKASFEGHEKKEASGLTQIKLLVLEYCCQNENLNATTQTDIGAKQYTENKPHFISEIYYPRPAQPPEQFFS